MKAIIDEGVTLVDVIHVMLHRGVQPLQARTSPLWRYVSGGDESIVQNFFRGKDLGGMLKILLNTKDNKFRTKGGDVGYCRACLATKVKFSFDALICYLSFHHILYLNGWLYMFILQDWRTRTKPTKSPAPQMGGTRELRVGGAIGRGPLRGPSPDKKDRGGPRIPR